MLCSVDLTWHKAQFTAIVVVVVEEEEEEEEVSKPRGSQILLYIWQRYII